MASVFIRNKSGQHFSDRYDGQDYTFPNGEMVEVPIEAAAHIFGFGRADKRDNLVRLGKSNHTSDMSAGISWLGNFEFKLAQSIPADDVPGSQPPVSDAAVQGEESPQAAAADLPKRNPLAKLADRIAHSAG